MTKEKLAKKWFNDPYYYNSDTIRGMTTEQNHSVDIALIYSGRNRGKSFEMAAKAIRDAWYSDGDIQFGYIRRYEKELYNYKVEKYFADKVQFIKDLTGEKCNCIICDKASIFLGRNYQDENGKVKREKVLEIGQTFALSMATQYKSLQYPKINVLLLEEVFTNDGYIEGEPEKLLSIVSTVKRDKQDFICYLVSNLVSKINPYTQQFCLKRMIRQKPGSIDEYKLYLGTLDKNGNEDFYYICVEYLKDREEVKELSEREMRKDNRDRLLNSNKSNRWEEAYLYPCISAKVMRDFETEYTCVFEYNEFMYQAELKQVPINLQFMYDRMLDTEEEMLLNDITMPVVFIQRKTGRVLDNTRLYTTNPVVMPLATRGYYVMNDFDAKIDELIDVGHCFFSDNLTGNEFKQALMEIKAYSF